jgi:hypothetical protein
MKNLILLLLVIGAVISQTALTTLAAEMWTLTYLTPTTTLDFARFTLTYQVTGAAVPANYITTSDDFIGVVCQPLLSTFAAITPGNAIVFSVKGNGATASNNAEAAWDPLIMTELSTAVFTSATVITTGTVGALCPIVIDTPSGGSANKPSFSSGVVSWTFTVTSSCGSLPSMDTTWYARCYAIPSAAADAGDVGGSAVTLAALGENNITYTAPTTTCSTTTGASTFATGATILAGIAYLQF